MMTQPGDVAVTVERASKHSHKPRNGVVVPNETPPPPASWLQERKARIAKSKGQCAFCCTIACCSGLLCVIFLWFLFAPLLDGPWDAATCLLDDSRIVVDKPILRLGQKCARVYATITVNASVAGQHEEDIVVDNVCLSGDCDDCQDPDYANAWIHNNKVGEVLTECWQARDRPGHFKLTDKPYVDLLFLGLGILSFLVFVYAVFNTLDYAGMRSCA